MTDSRENPKEGVTPATNRPGPIFQFATVAIDQPLDKLLSYRIPRQLVDWAGPGRRVQVPLGRGDKLVTGTIISVENVPAAGIGVGTKKRKTADRPRPAAKKRCDEEPSLWSQTPPPQTDAVGNEAEPSDRNDTMDMRDARDIHLPESLDTPATGNIKAIHNVLTEVQPFTPELMRLAIWISHYYCCPLGQVLSTIMPAAVKRNTRVPQKFMVFMPRQTPDTPESPALAKLSARAKKSYESAATALAKGSCELHELVRRGVLSRPMLKRFVALGLLLMERQTLAPGSGSPTPEGTGKVSGESVPASTSSLNQRPVLELTMDQTAAFNSICPFLESPQFAVRLIHGVTGSGKTELYIRCIERVVAAGRRAIVLVPEISLTAQAVARFTARFERVAVLHSGMKDSQRHQHWQSIAAGWAQVIVGARSAIFAPVENLGIIVVDEEHDTSYKQDSAPRYHGRDVAIRRAQLAGIPVLLGSATPSLESWVNADRNPNYKMLALSSRPNNMLMPRVMTVNMREEHRQRRGLHALSTTMEFQLKKTLAEKGQAILLLNRRGYAHYLACAKCSWVLMCEHCDATMVVHLNQIITSGHDSIVKCHYCLTSQLLPDRCPDCQAGLVQLGQGTQRVEEELARKFPRARIARMDSDSMRKTSDYEKTLEAFGSGELDLLLGTQMIAKGLDFPNVRLVGVLNADLAMTSPDFRAAERTFDLVCQVAGRSGRAGPQGLVVVQTMQPDEPAIVHATRHDYMGFAQSELPHRREFGYPPYGRIVRVIVTHKTADKADEICREIASLIEQIVGGRKLSVRVVGPQLPPMARIMDEYRREIQLFSATAMPLQQIISGLRAGNLLQMFPGCVTVDVDPFSMQ